MTARRAGMTLATALAVTFNVGGVVAAASPVPATQVAPVASPSAMPVDCGMTTAFLPPAMDGVPIITSTTAGVTAVDPDDLFDPMLAALGRTRADLCVVAFRYGEADAALAGQLVRIVDADAADLAGRFVGALRDIVVGQGGSAVPSVLDLGGQVLWSLDVAARGQETLILAWQRGDTLLVASDLETMERLVPAVAGRVEPAPSMVIESPPG